MTAIFLIGGAALAALAFSTKAFGLNLPRVLGTQPASTNVQNGVTITRGGAIPSGPQGGGVNVLGLTQTGTGVGLGVVSSVSHTGSALASAVPVVGAIAAVGFAVLGAIRANHAKAVALEANTLNQVMPVVREQFLLIVKALGERALDVTGAGVELDKIVAAYYQMVSKIIKGKWSYSGPLDYVGTGGTGRQPDPCNGPCVVGHYWVEGDAYAVRLHAPHIYNGAHGEFNLDAIPPHAGFNGYPAATIRY